MRDQNGKTIYKGINNSPAYRRAPVEFKINKIIPIKTENQT